jgi:hypothetical protein
VPATATSSGAQRLIQPLRRRVRLRTRLRRLRRAWRQAHPRRLRRWTPGSPPAIAAPDRPATAIIDGLVVAELTAAGPPDRQGYGPPLATGELQLATDATGTPRWVVLRDRGRVPVVRGQVGRALDERQSAVLSRLAAIRCPPTRQAPPAAWAQLLVQLALTGVPLHIPARGQRDPAPSGRDDPILRQALAPELAALLTEPLPPPGSDPMRWEIRSIRQRRAAMRHHLAGLDPPSVTAVLVSRRPQLLAGAVAALAAQTYPQLEIVVGMHGAAAPGNLPSGERPLRIVPVPPQQTLGEALAAATAAVSGAVITKVDDDDRYGPEHVWDLVLARHRTGATLVGKGAEFVYLEPKDLTVRRRMAAEVFTNTVAGGTLTLARAELTALGGWPPVPRSVDRLLLDQLLAAGGTAYRTHPLGFIYTRHGDGHTWNPGLEYFLRDPVRTWRGLPPYAEFGPA